ncbi:MAG: molecular chaperone TorD family protein [Ectothiorhodospiraceae bacterium]|nr:molecular chaperone TorD family protein [Chromatiales bacterium]MCP5154307.1 molecular chaperone TorD family protein [Ectothiorhodospiraceae bacterium]
MATTGPLRRFCGLCSADLDELAALHAGELDGAAVLALRRVGFPDSLGVRLVSERGRSILASMAAVVAELDDGADSLDRHAADFAAIYLTHGYGAAPSESVWLDDEGLAMQGPMFEVRRAYARQGLKAPDWRLRPDDHLVHQLEFVAVLVGRGDHEALETAAAFLDAHLLRWLPAFAARVAARSETSFYAGLAALTAVYLEELREVLAQVLERPRPVVEPLPRRGAPSAEEAPYLPGLGPGW